MPVTATLAHAAVTGESEQWADLLGVLVVAGLGAAYGRGVHELWARRGIGSVVTRTQAGTFLGGLLVVMLAQRGPLHDLAEASLAGHMTQHMVLLLIAGPLLAAGGAGLPLTLSAPRRLRTALARLRTTGPVRWLRRPLNYAVVAATVHTVAIWAWHLPKPFTWAEGNPWVHAAEHASFVGAAWLLWSAVLSPRAEKVSGPVGFLLLFVTGMPAAALGAVLTLAPRVVYPGTSLADQQLAGLIMWVPMDAVMLVAAVTLFLRWMFSLDRDSPGDRDLRPTAEEVSA
jgi:putative membrane protein